jgi:hypothetical protein
MSPFELVMILSLWIGFRIFALRRQEDPISLDGLFWVGSMAGLFSRMGGIFLIIGISFSARNAFVARHSVRTVGEVLYVQRTPSTTYYSGVGRAANSGRYARPSISFYQGENHFTFDAWPTWIGHYHKGQQVTVFHVKGDPSRAWLSADLIYLPIQILFLGGFLLLIGKRSEYLQGREGLSDNDET